MQIENCNHNPCQKTFQKKNNKKFCSRDCKDKSNKEKKRRPWRLFIESKCSSCGFIPLHICQLDVDHIDGNKQNNNASNLQTLCANCHRLKTYLNKDWKK
ncbi:HNHc domain containing protein [uncultured Caudovirales phage]|uniref:HNHc domain containing protein n=1 Tax=uncultured Caudovirales phage TaxID=2100421 RepID=A0A6J7WIG5_9CAUD|nr:HNHc domain containing protein [uncultured Caudovirales phage]